MEGVPADTILAALERAGVICEDPQPQNLRVITKTDLYELGLSGREDSARRRKAFLNKLGLPEHLAVNPLVKVLNSMMTVSYTHLDVYKRQWRRLPTL